MPVMVVAVRAAVCMLPVVVAIVPAVRLRATGEAEFRSA